MKAPHHKNTKSKSFDNIQVAMNLEYVR